MKDELKDLIIIILIILSIATPLFMIFWNFTIPELFGFKNITYLQSLGIIGMFQLLFGGYKK